MGGLGQLRLAPPEEEDAETVGPAGPGLGGSNGLHHLLGGDGDGGKIVSERCHLIDGREVLVGVALEYRAPMCCGGITRQWSSVGGW